MARRHVILVGLPGSGKTTVGRLAGAMLGAPFTDLDADIEARAGKSVVRIFREDGEAAFRALELAAGEAVLRGPPGIVAPGGGFVADAARRRLALENGLVIYLQVRPAVAAERIAAEGGRPLLDSGDLPSRIGELLTQREGAYLEAEASVTTDSRLPGEVAAEVVRLARERGGW